MRRIIFLDIDGVLNTERNYRSRLRQGLPWRDENGPYFDPEAVEALTCLVEHTEADIVITSTWRLLGEDRMQTLWATRQMPGILLGGTPQILTQMYAVRGQEIAAWLAQNVAEDEECRYVIIDDGRDFLPEQIPFCVFVNPEVGITEEDARKALALVNQVESEANKGGC